MFSSFVIIRATFIHRYSHRISLASVEAELPFPTLLDSSSLPAIIFSLVLYTT